MATSEKLILEEKLQIFTRGLIVFLIFSAFQWLFTLAIDPLLSILPLVILVVGFLFAWSKTFTKIQVFDDRVEVVGRFLVTSKRRIEASKIESVDVSQSLLGRSLYGSLSIRGSGTATLHLSALRNPEEVAEAVRGIASKSQAKSEPNSEKRPEKRPDGATSALAELIAMKEQGHLTEKEFSAAKSKLLG